MRKGDICFYLGSDAHVIRAVVLKAHRDGLVDIEAQFFNDEGKDHGPYLGFKFRSVEVFPNAMEAEIARTLLQPYRLAA
jgi:hypothetical protein